jgi:hypothetical protein
MRATDAPPSRCKNLIHAALELRIVVIIPDISWFTNYFNAGVPDIYMKHGA